MENLNEIKIFNKSRFFATRFFYSGLRFTQDEPTYRKHSTPLIPPPGQEIPTPEISDPLTRQRKKSNMDRDQARSFLERPEYVTRKTSTDSNDTSAADFRARRRSRMNQNLTFAATADASKSVLLIQNSKLVYL